MSPKLCVRAWHSVRFACAGLLLASACHGSAAVAPTQEAQAQVPAGRTEATSDLDAGPASASCPRVKPPEVVGKLPETGLDEVSGLIASRANPGLLWVHNDSGDSPRVFAIQTNGKVRYEVALRGAQAVDYEDIAIGPGPVEGKTYLYVGDIGDNLARREHVQIYRFEEPSLAADGPTKLTADAARIDLAYEGGPRDAEALLVDAASGDLFIVAKGSFFSSHDAPIGLYRIARQELLKPQALAHFVLNLPLGPVTAADLVPDGSGVAIRNYRQLFFWPRAPGQSLVEALSGTPCPWPLADTKKQGESFGFRADGLGYFTISEGEEQPIYFYALESLR
ncbi:MAG: hypothetical protein QM778_12770 [Myxococcales bacterium]